MVFLFMAIVIFEIAYKKDDDDLVIQGIEVLVLSAYTLTSQHITKKYNFNFKNYSLVASYFFAIYFIVKCIVIYTKGRKEMAEDYSDIKEIVKKDEPIKKEDVYKRQPVSMEIDGKKGYVIVFRCKKCGAIRRNKAAKDDNMDFLIDLSSKQI